MQTQDGHSPAEPEQMCGLVPTSPESGMKQHDSFIQSILATSIDDETINSWLSQGTQADHMESLDPQLFPGELGQHESQITQEHDNLFTTMNPYHESDKTRPVLTSPNSSTSLYPFSNATMCVDSRMNLSPTTSKAFSLTNDGQQPPGGFEGQATLTDVIETTTPSSSHEIPPVNTPAERGKTVLTLENLDPETRSEVLDWLCRRKIVTTIEIV